MIMWHSPDGLTNQSIPYQDPPKSCWKSCRDKVVGIGGSGSVGLVSALQPGTTLTYQASINSLALLSRMMSVAPDVTWKLRDLLDIKFERQDHEWMETMQRLTITEKNAKRPVATQSRDVERDRQPLVNQLVNSVSRMSY